MKYLVFCCFLLTAASASILQRPQPPTVILAGNAIDNLVRSAFEYIRKLMKEHEPLVVPDAIIPEQDINDDEFKAYLKAVLTNVKISKGSDFQVDHIENNLFKLWAKFGVTVPTVQCDGKYAVTGSVLDKAVTGNGDFSFNLTQLIVRGQVQLEILDHAMHIKDLNFNYTFGELQVEETGLSVEGMTQEQLNDVFSRQLNSFFHDNMEAVTRKIARQVRIEANDLMKGKTLQQLLDWLHKVIGH